MIKASISRLPDDSGWSIVLDGMEVADSARSFSVESVAGRKYALLTLELFVEPVPTESRETIIIRPLEIESSERS